MRRVCPPCVIRIPVTVWLAGLAWLCLAPGAGAARQGATQASRGVRGSGVRVSGTVVDGRTQEPVMGAAVRLVDAFGGRAASGESDAAGSFSLPPVPVGTYALSIQRIGYENGSGTLDLHEQADPSLTISLVPHEIDIDPLVVTVARSTSVLADFERRRSMGSGSFLTRAEIERQRPHQVTDLFRMLPGVRIVPGRAGNAVVLRGGCRPTMYFDGVAVDAGPSLDFSLGPDDVEAIEVHTTATAPPQYARNACGVILVWTRVPVRTHGHVPLWKGLLVVAGVLGVKLLIR
ncbi:MAG: carboxypeptidase regulatory-like domain-containing protein [Longimicrobiales bacterium]|nr:carboxypeptidase regulatory-like domain-containing protein [Longimicrobiales bacterium]